MIAAYSWDTLASEKRAWFNHHEAYTLTNLGGSVFFPYGMEPNAREIVLAALSAPPDVFTMPGFRRGK
jgi:hypothetical protein